MQQKLIFTVLTLFTISLLKAQSISPTTNEDYCPGIDYTFSVTIPGNSPVVVSKALNVAPPVFRTPSKNPLKPLLDKG